MTRKDHIEQFIRDLRSTDYYCRRIIELNLTLEMLECKLQGVKSPSIQAVYRNIRTPYQNNKLALMEQDSHVVLMREKYAERILECEKIERIADANDKCLIVDLFILKQKYITLEKNIHIRDPQFTKKR